LFEFLIDIKKSHNEVFIEDCTIQHRNSVIGTQWVTKRYIFLFLFNELAKLGQVKKRPSWRVVDGNCRIIIWEAFFGCKLERKQYQLINWIKLINIASFYYYNKTSNQEYLMKISLYIYSCNNPNDNNSLQA
jgi:hypothetical protein